VATTLKLLVLPPPARAGMTTANTIAGIAAKRSNLFRMMRFTRSPSYKFAPSIGYLIVGEIIRLRRDKRIDNEPAFS
jgi:hypothetical protein